jgi:hypothetical protein
MAFGIKKNQDVVKEGEVKEVKEVKMTRKEKKEKKATEKTLEGTKMDQPTEVERTDSLSSDGSSKGVTSYLWGGQKKKPRAEFQSEIDELELQLAALETANSELQTTNNRLQQTSQKYDTLRRWAQNAPVH